MLLNEGGNIWDEVEPYDQESAPALEKQLEKYLSGTGLNVYRIGSGATPTPGKMSGDLDVMVDLDVAAKAFNEQDPKLVRIALEKFLQSKGLDTRRIAVTVHVKMPFGNKFHQVDIKVVKNAANVYRFHVHDIPKGSPWKGVNKQMMLNTLASSQGMLWSPDEGLYARNAAGKKAQLLSTDLDEIAQYLLGKNASAKDLGSVESIMAAIPDEARRTEIFAKAKASSSWQAATPDVGTNEWFSYTKNKLAILESEVTELFQPGKEWKWSFKGSSEAVAVFYVGEIPYQFYAHGSDGAWEISFKNAQRGGNRGTKFGLTGTGNSAEVMGTVVDIMRSFLDSYKNNISELIFTAKEDSRRGLYAKMIKRLLPNWTLTQNEEHFTLVPPEKDPTQSLATGTNEWFSYTKNKLATLEETYVLDEGLGNWITKKIDDLLGSPSISSQQISQAMAKAPANIPDSVAEKLVTDFLAKKDHEAALERAAQAQKTTVEKLKPYLTYFVGEFIERWKRIPQRDKQQALKNLATSVVRLLMFILEAMLKSKR